MPSRRPSPRAALAALALLAPAAARAQVGTARPAARPAAASPIATAAPAGVTWATAGVRRATAVGAATRLAGGALRQRLTLADASRDHLPGALEARPLYTGPVIPVPAGYGRYCSVVRDDGTWMFGVLPGADSDPCADVRRAMPGSRIARAGLWDTRGENNVLARCGGDLRVYRAPGGTAPRAAYDEARGKRDCVFVVTPARLPIFGLPYGKTDASQDDPSADVQVSRGFDYNVYNVPMDPAMFGRSLMPGTTTAIWIDRTGRQRDYLNAEGKRADGEPAWDLTMPAGKPLLAVAPGVVRAAQWLDVKRFNCGDDRQGEVYIEHQVGTGEYAERFVSYYAHARKHTVATGATVAAGQQIGEAGNTGCSGGDHLHLGVMHTTNTSGRRWHPWSLDSAGYSTNVHPALIDPFGWSAPQHVDPWAWMALGVQPGGLANPGAFSIDLWAGAKPPNTW